MPVMVRLGNLVIRADAVLGWELLVNRSPGIAVSYGTKLYLSGGQTVMLEEQIETVSTAIRNAWRKSAGV